MNKKFVYQVGNNKKVINPHLCTMHDYIPIAFCTQISFKAIALTDILTTSSLNLQVVGVLYFRNLELALPTLQFLVMESSISPTMKRLAISLWLTLRLPTYAVFFDF
jgi:hypothetical protein